MVYSFTAEKVGEFRGALHVLFLRTMQWVTYHLGSIEVLEALFRYDISDFAMVQLVAGLLHGEKVEDGQKRARLLLLRSSARRKDLERIGLGEEADRLSVEFEKRWQIPPPPAKRMAADVEAPK